MLIGFRHDQTILRYPCAAQPSEVCFAPETPKCLCMGGTWEDDARYNNICPEPLFRIGPEDIGNRALKPARARRDL